MTAFAIRPEVADAIAADRPVVALESTIVSHGLPRPDNLTVARRVEHLVRERGATPATVAVLDGVVHVGLDDSQLTEVACRDDMVKASARDLPAVVATGGIGGVHRLAQESWDESADLVALARTAICVVCAGVKSILDVPATLERLETLGVAVLGFGTNAFPGFYLTDSGYRLDWRVDSPADVAAVLRAQRELGLPPAAILVANPLPEGEQVDPSLHDRVLTEALAAAGRSGVSGKDVTPFLLAAFHRETGGASLAANVRIIERNAELAAQIAVARASA
ncbi:MAG: pseudouridine-5'-phosphate glycosidase [Actinomycetota bacterium]|nr:pseudouridine-5'-phosphate glycosidase [Actinomycetota bacterium]